MAGTRQKSRNEAKRETAAPSSLQRLLFRSSRETYDDDAVQALIRADPSAARAAGGRRFPVLHHVLQIGCSAVTAETARLLCDACPDLLREVVYAQTPLHYACRYGATLDAVRLMHERRPESLAAKDMNGCTPLHDACDHSTYGGVHANRVETVEFLLEQRPDAAVDKDNFGRTPLALVCRSGSERHDGYKLLNLLIAKYPDAAKEKDRHGRSPLHRACANRMSLPAVAALVDAHPEAVGMKNNSGDTPLHGACRCGAHLEVVQLLVEKCPDALDVQNGSGQTPLQCATSHGSSSSEVIETLQAMQILRNPTANEEQVTDVLRFFHSTKWPGGAALAFNAFPSLVAKLDHELMPYVLSFVGRRCCRLDTFFAMLQDNPVLVKGAVKRKAKAEGGQQSQSKKVRTK